jgi:HEAT repeat protein
MKELALIGPPAVPALRRQLLEGEDRAMQHAATVIGWMRLPANEAFLREQLANAMPPARRRELVRSLAMHKEPSCLPLFVAIAGGSELPAVRTEAVNGIRQLGILGVGCADRAVAEALDAAVASKNEALRQEALQAMLSMQAPLALAPLLAVLGDRRPMFDEFRLCDNALWVIERQLGMHVEIDGKTESKCTPEAAAFLEQWFAANGNRLEWDAKVAHWVPTR